MQQWMVSTDWWNFCWTPGRKIFGILLAVYREGKLDEQIKELREAAEEQF